MAAVTEHNKTNKLDAVIMHHTATRTGNVRKKARTNENSLIAVAKTSVSIPKIPPMHIAAAATPKSKQKQTRKQKDKNASQQNK